jgi:hypothetical protein
LLGVFIGLPAGAVSGALMGVRAANRRDRDRR